MRHPNEATIKLEFHSPDKLEQINPTPLPTGPFPFRKLLLDTMNGVVTPNFQLPLDFFESDSGKLDADRRTSVVKAFLGLRASGVSSRIFIPALTQPVWLEKKELLALAGDLAAVSNQITRHSQPDHTGPIEEVVTGPMFSGKTESLQARYQELQESGQQVIAVKPDRENRYGNGIKTHGQKDQADGGIQSVELITSFDDLVYIAEDNPGAHLLVEEAMFLSPTDLITNLPRLSTIRLSLYGLDMDFRQLPFNIGTFDSFGSLMILAGGTTKNMSQTNYPSAKNPQYGPYSARLMVGQAGETVLQGGSEMYKPTNLADHPFTPQYATWLQDFLAPLAKQAQVQSTQQVVSL